MCPSSRLIMDHLSLLSSNSKLFRTSFLNGEAGDETDEEDDEDGAADDDYEFVNWHAGFDGSGWCHLGGVRLKEASVRGTAVRGYLCTETKAQPRVYEKATQQLCGGTGACETVVFIEIRVRPSDG